MCTKLLKTAFLEIKSRKKIFISILFMAFLGVGFFAGIKATAPSMKKTLESYFNDTDTFDIEISSSSGINDDLLKDIKKINNVVSVEPMISFDSIGLYKDYKPVIKVFNLSNSVNTVNLVSGRLPLNSEECVIDATFKENESFVLGDYIEIIDHNNILQNKKMKIVGLVNSSLYISSLRGSTNLSNGNIDYFMYIPSNNFIINSFNYLSLTIDSDNERYTDSYKSDLNKVIADIKSYDDTLYLSTIYDNVGYSNFIQDTERIDNIAKIFPIIFFVVAVLISLTSMTRMVEEQRIEIGTLKSLGYSGIHISLKYIIYASIATIVGGIFGIIVGVNLIPRIINMMYQMMYTTKELIIDYNIFFSLFGLLIAYLCINGATIYVIVRELKNSPSVLMRPKVIKGGKRVFLEKIGFIWKHINFTNKVTIRNLFRYKKRFLMTILGVAGCTSLIFAGFGLKESVSSLLHMQYDETFVYDVEASVATFLNDDDLAYIKNISEIDNYKIVGMERVNTSNNDLVVEDVSLITMSNFDDIDNYINIIDYELSKKLSLDDDGIIITEKLSKLLDVKVGDTISVKNYNNNIASVIIKGISKNYLYHYIYMSRDTYFNLFNINSVDNTLLVNTKDDINSDIIVQEMLKNSNFARVVSTDYIASMMDDTMENLNYVVWVLIVSAGILAFCVLYNLANVNISERKRELATIKVLGFYDKEVYNYVEKETTILTILGIVLGLIMGNFLSIIIIKTCELDMMMFPINYSFECYLYSILITIFFTVIVNITVYFSLKKIDMIESLKSVE